jgi:hypothetical protein
MDRSGLDYFPPSAARAREYREAMDSALLESARLVLEQLSAAPSPADGRGSGMHSPAALDYGAYFDLLLDPPHGEPISQAERTAAIEHLTGRLGDGGGNQPAPPPLPTITALSDGYYPPDAIARLVRWWDIEPDNAMALIGVSVQELDVARGLILTALDRMEQAVPELHGEIVATVRDIIISKQDETRLHSFAGATSFALWGAMLLNFDAHQHWQQYYKSIIHEGAHNLLFAIARNEPLVSDDPHDWRHSPLRGQDRPMDGIYHAAFVSARESLALDRLLSWHEKSGGLSQDEIDAAESTLEGCVLSFWSCAEAVRREGHLTPLGQAILDECEEFMTANFAVVAD